MQKENSELTKSEYIYTGNDLGVNYTPEKTQIRIWAPVAARVEFSLFAAENDTEPELKKELSKDINGTWKLEIPGDWSGYYYLFDIYYGSESKKTVDPYARAVGTDSKKGLIVDLAKTDPRGWEKDQRKEINCPQEAIIYELHVRDFSVSSESGLENRGQYLAFTERGTTNSQGDKTGIEHLKELGITHVHLLPVFDFASVRDNSEEYNWGYDPYYYNVPEGSYATDPSDDSRIREFKQMVQSLHENEIGVIMDVVFNHTYYSEQSAFQKIAPDYFYRFKDGDFANGSGVGNEIASERPMVRKFIVDSVSYWAREYHIDGFRFDLMGLMDKETMEQIEQTVHEIDSSILLYGEPWCALPSQLDETSCPLVKGNQKNMQIAVFNDNFRDAIKGDLEGNNAGFISGSVHRESEIKKGVVGAVEYNKDIKDFAARPGETVNFVSCHDNLTLWDYISLNYSQLDEAKLIKMDRLAQAIIFTSQGIAFIQGGEEFLRTKYGHDNSYNAGDFYNQLKWERKSKYRDTFEYYQGLIQLRKEHPAFHINDVEQLKKHLQFIETPPYTVGFKLIDFANGDEWEEIIVLYNPLNDWTKFRFDREEYRGIILDDSQAGVCSFNNFKADNVNVPPISAMVLRKL